VGKTAAELRAEAQHLRRLARFVTDAQALAEINKMIEELEQRAREAENGRS
jgi:hypothetical protein